MEKFIEVVTGVFCLHDGKICLVRTKKNPQFFTLPGGHLNFGETLVDCAKRELLEETGNRARNFQILGWGELIVREHWIYFNVSCEVNSPQSLPKAGEILEVIWLLVSEAKKDKRVLPRLREELKIFYNQ